MSVLIKGVDTPAFLDAREETEKVLEGMNNG